MRKTSIFFILSIVLLSVSAFATDLQRRAPIAGVGPAQNWQQELRVESIRSLAKSVNGDTTFYIRKDIYASPITLEEVGFYRKYADDKIVIFVENVEYDEGRVTDADISQLRDALLYQTPASSINPEKGIWSNELDIFGDAPDVDRNGLLFVLLIDVRDDYENSDSDTYVAGYFDPLDQDASRGNYSDIIYVDTNPANANDAETLSVVAHELQHLIHFNYDPNEATWLNEGLAELAPRLLGYPFRSFASFLSDTNRPLNQFDASITDYSKVGLWTFYFAQRFGLDLIKKIVQEPENSLLSYEKVLQSNGYGNLTFLEVMRDWFLANLLNDPLISDGRYSYRDANLPYLTSPHFRSNFTNGEPVADELSPAAAEYIQFYSGSAIDFTLNHANNSQFYLAVVKHSSPVRISFMQANQLRYNVSDPAFGVDYAKITFIPYNLKITSSQETTQFSYTASGKGGYEETELIQDGDVVTSYITMQNYEAAERFDLPNDGSELAAVKFYLSSESPVTIRIYTQRNGNPVAVYNDVVPNAAAWTRLDVAGLTLPQNSTEIYVSVQSPDNSLGYSNTEAGQGRAYLKVNTTFQDLNNFTTTGDQTLTGDWVIRAVLRKRVERLPEMVIEPSDLYFWNNEYRKNFTISNNGTLPLTWSIPGEHLHWVSVQPEQGTAVNVANMVEVFVDRNILDPGLHDLYIPIDSNAGRDSLRISVLERNYRQAQSAAIVKAPSFSDSVASVQIKLFNIGTGEGYFAFIPDHNYLRIYPETGYISANDTVAVLAYLDKDLVSAAKITLRYYNGVDTASVMLRFEGVLNAMEAGLAVFTPAPNPFVLSTVSSANLRIRLGSDQPASLKIYNVLGQEIRSFAFPDYRAGFYLFTWDGKNRYGDWVSSGVYFIVLEQAGNIARQKILFLK